MSTQDSRLSSSHPLAKPPFWQQARCAQNAALQWARRARGPVPFVVQEVHQRMMHRAQVLRPPEGGVLHQGWLHPLLLQASTTVFANRPMQALVPLGGVLPQPSLWQRLLGGLGAARFAKPIWQEYQYELPYKLPLPSHSMAVVWCPLGLDAVDQPKLVLAEWFRVLKPGGCVFFAGMGPDTAQALRPVAQAMGVPMADYVDMHDWGDALAQCGFADPVMEMERLDLHYASPQALLADWRGWCGNALDNLPTGLRGKTRYAEALSSLERQRAGDGRVHLNLELLYGHAWKLPQTRPAPGGEVRIAIESIGGRRGR